MFWWHVTFRNGALIDCSKGAGTTKKERGESFYRMTVSNVGNGVTLALIAYNEGMAIDMALMISRNVNRHMFGSHGQPVVIPYSNTGVDRGVES